MYLLPKVPRLQYIKCEESMLVIHALFRKTFNGFFKSSNRSAEDERGGLKLEDVLVEDKKGSVAD